MTTKGTISLKVDGKEVKAKEENDFRKEIESLTVSESEGSKTSVKLTFGENVTIADKQLTIDGKTANVELKDAGTDVNITFSGNIANNGNAEFEVVVPESDENIETKFTVTLTATVESESVTWLAEVK